jgi:hypothetical protein
MWTITTYRKSGRLFILRVMGVLGTVNRAGRAAAVRTYNLNFPSLAPGTSNASFGSVSSPATGLVTNGSRSNNVGVAVPQANVQNVPGQRQAGTGVGTGIGAATQRWSSASRYLARIARRQPRPS